MAARAEGRGALFGIGWWALVVVTALFAVNHAVGAATLADSADERMMYLALTALQAVALVVLLVPYRRLERWAWWVSWVPILAIATALPVLGGGIGVAYAAVAGAMALAQLAARPKFSRRSSTSPSA